MTETRPREPDDDLPAPPSDPEDPPRTRRAHIERSLLDEHALTVVRRLQRHGHEAYLVGGCVRDLLAGHEPKDFDVATDARPNRIKRVFRNARIIGRRFRLAHIHFGEGRVIETATFRGPPPVGEDADEQDEGSPENVFGTAAEDARRRDFTINALFYDPVRDEILDWVGGLDDVEARVVRSIGDPATRIYEDPVRMIRAVHFAVRLDFQIEPTLERAIAEHADRIVEASQARLYVELLKILGRGAAWRTLHRLHRLGVLAHWVPEVVAFLDEPRTWGDLAGPASEPEDPEGLPPSGAHATWNLLGVADRWGLGAGGAEEAMLLAPLLAPWIVSAWLEDDHGGYLAWCDRFDETVRPLAQRTSMPRRTLGRLKEALWLWLTMRHPPDGRWAHKVVRRQAFPLALSFLRLDLEARNRVDGTLAAWEELGARSRPAAHAHRRDEDEEPRRRRRGGRSGRGRRGRRAGPGSAAHGDGEGGGAPRVGSEAAAWTPAPPPPERGPDPRDREQPPQRDAADV